jgi:type III restriction enzyme
MPSSVCFDENDIEECTQKNYAYNRCLLKKERSQPEKPFEQYLKDHATTICFWYKNGDSGKTNFGIRYAEEERIGTFYPDFIVGFNDGRIGIFDTQSGFTEKSSETKAKAEYLQRYIISENAKVNHLFGGIIAESKQAVLKINSATVYQSQDKAQDDWLPLTTLFQ